ncbi:hypothetical protein SKAU_G00238400 [Synaphobranchus kaupii]|uniref:Uncharacterized protein n=1 Tax=Synaphobranchus kaupii TaxID=118154 RepID=A0A9Q1F7I7_SYNKA|nr:hypothetical protein SKAU_G00238400 [Synaphobranchus kaupii]
MANAGALPPPRSPSGESKSGGGAPGQEPVFRNETVSQVGQDCSDHNVRFLTDTFAHSATDPTLEGEQSAQDNGVSRSADVSNAAPSDDMERSGRMSSANGENSSCEPPGAEAETSVL